MPRIGNHTSNAAPDVVGPRLVLLLCVLGLTLLGFVMIYSASSISAISEDISSAAYLIDQLQFAVVGVVAMFVLWKLVPYRFWEGPAIWVIWGIAVALLLLTAVMGLSALGAQRWLRLGPISLQPSEFVKIAIILMAARLFSEFSRSEAWDRAHTLLNICGVHGADGWSLADAEYIGLFDHTIPDYHILWDRGWAITMQVPRELVPKVWRCSYGVGPKFYDRDLHVIFESIFSIDGKSLTREQRRKMLESEGRL